MNTYPNRTESFTDPQELFDFATKHLLAMEKQAVTTHGGSSCMYRTEDGRACVVGAMIPDDQYAVVFDSRSARVLNEDSVGARLRKAAGLPEAYHHTLCELADDLQQVHDNPYYWMTPDGTPGLFNQDGIEALRKVAHDYDLSSEEAELPRFDR